MPNPTYRVSVIGRGGRRSAVGMAAYGAGQTLQVSSVLAAAAYRAGQTLHDHSKDQQYDYSDRDDVQHTEILAPDHAPDWVYDREALWNAVEMRENRVNSQLARSIIIALPRELDLDQNIELLRTHVQDQFVSKGMIADVAIHDKSASDGGTNPHAHILLTLREVDEQGEWLARKNREWNDQSLIHNWRDGWEDQQNAWLEAAEVEERVSLKSYADQGINRAPQLHVGPRVDYLEKQGVETRVGEINRDIVQDNVMREVMDAMLPAGNDWFVGDGFADELALMQADEISRLHAAMFQDGLDRDIAMEMGS